MIARIAPIFLGVTVVICLIGGFIAMAITAPWWVTVWIALFLGAAFYCSYKF